MSWIGPLLASELERVAADPNAQRRGRGLEQLLVALFKRAHFQVKVNPGAARPRQTDLVAVAEQDRYLVEAKWTKMPVTVDAIAGLRDRLARVESSVVGVLVSMSGFTSTAIAEAESRRDRVIILLAAADVDALVEERIQLRDLLDERRQSLLIHGRASPPARSSRTSQLVGDVGVDRRSPAAFTDLAGGLLPWWEAEGGFSPLVFVQELFDVDWVTAGGHGVSCDIDVQVDDAPGLITILRELSAAGWLSHRGRWCLRQTATNWHGIGVAALIDAIDRWEERHERLETLHHTEDLGYAEECDGGHFTLVADLSADSRRRVWSASLSFQLVGTPVDVAPFRNLRDITGTHAPIYFRPIGRKAVETAWCRRSGLPLQPLGYVVQPDANTGERWVTGLVCRNPVYDSPPAAPQDLPPWCEPVVADSAVLICDLRSHHLLGETRDYVLWKTEWTLTSDALCFRPLADWL